MCVYHYEDSKRAEIWIFILLLAAMLFSVGVTIPMFILTYPGDECLLFVSVRGEALIYGNPAGCNFIGFGHMILLLLGIVALALIFFRPKKGIIRRKQPKEIGSTRSLRGTQLSGQNSIGLGQSHYNFQTEDTVSQFGISRFFSAKTIVIGVFASTFSIITALVILSGYLVTCNELHYETRRQVLGRNTLGSPIRNLNIQCWSLFRDTDFHTRFHFDHYEYSGQWHGQYRGYEHGRQHNYENKHDHLIGVALALELSLSSTWFCSALWVTVTILMILLRRRQKHLQARELAESIEDAKIFASSRQLDPSQNIMMRPISDQMSVTSHQSSVLSQKPSVTSGYSVSTQPMGSVIHNPNGAPMVVQQQILSQQELLNQQMLQMQQLQMANQQRLHQSQPVLNSAMPQANQRPMSQQIVRPIQTPITQQMAQQTHQQQMAQQQIAQQQMAQQQMAQQHLAQQQMAQQQLAQQQLAQQQSAQQQIAQQQMAQQNGIQYVQLSNGVIVPSQQVMPQPIQQKQPVNSTSNNSSKHQYSSIEETLKQSLDQTDNSKSAQKLQLNMSQDAGLKCSQI